MTRISVLLNPKDSPALVASGYGKIAQYVAPMLMDLGYDVRLHCRIGHEYSTINWVEPLSGRELQIWSGGDGPYGENLTIPHLQRLSKETQKPGTLLFIGDVLALNQIPKFCQDGHVAAATWGAADWESPTPKWATDKFRPFNKAWSMSHHGHRVLQEAGLQNLLEPLWFGCNTDVWKPEDRGAFPTMMESMGYREDTFNVFSAFANQYQRKGEYEMFLSIAEFHRRHPEANIRFFVFSQIRRDWDLVALAEHLGIRDLVRFSDDYTHIMGEYTERDVAQMMNCSDAVLSLGYEGFGFQTIEAQALNKPVIGFGAAATPELLGPGNGILVAPAKEFMIPNMIRRLLPSEAGVVEALEELWRTKDDARWKNGRKWILENLTWKHTMAGLKDRMKSFEDSLAEDGQLGPPAPGALANDMAKRHRTYTPQGA